MSLPQDPEPSADDDAARAGWLYFRGGLTQDQIAREIGVSRQRAQRLVSRAMAEGLITVRLNHRIGACLELEAALTDRFALTRCRIAPTLAGVDPARAIAPAASAEMERYLRQPEALTIALGTGRALRAMVDEIGSIEAPQHRLVSLIGNIAPDGAASFFDVVMKLADKVRAPHYPMPVPVIAETAGEVAAFRALGPVRRVVELAQAADVVMVGVGQMSNDAPLRLDGFVTESELSRMRGGGAVGEVGGWIFDSQGRYLEDCANSRTGGVRVEAGLERPALGIAAGATKVPAIVAALKGRILNGLVTDEASARAILSLR